ncbi:hypothetical protein BC567DRAFT_15621 [Phyllosticta citribraziliensis]
MTEESSQPASQPANRVAKPISSVRPPCGMAVSLPLPSAQHCRPCGAVQPGILNALLSGLRSVGKYQVGLPHFDNEE